MIDPNTLTAGLRVCDQDGRLATVVRVDPQLHLCSLVYDDEDEVIYSGMPFSKLADYHIKGIGNNSREIKPPSAALQQTTECSALGIRELTSRALMDPIQSGTLVSSGGLEQRDKELAKLWLKREPTSKDLNRMLSARNAEKAVASFFRDSGCCVQDVAILQLDQPRGGEWEKFDLRVDEVAIDVKNARSSPESEERYVSHCVPKFKQEYRPIDPNGETRHILIAGILSPYLGRLTESCSEMEVRFLGLMDAARLECLRQMLGQGPLRLSLHETADSSDILLPPWIFDYPKNNYAKRDAALELIRAEGWRETEPNATVSSAVAVAADIEIAPSLGLRDDHRAFVLILTARIKKHGLLLPVVYLTVLEQFIKLLVAKEPFDFKTDDYLTLVFPSPNLTRPVFIFDPLKTVHTLIVTLSNLWKRRNIELRGMKSFQLCGLNILRGKTDDNSDDWKTILAYCGGENKEARKAGRSAPCGNTPLVLGECALCRHGRLVCPRCYFCCSKCHPRTR